MAACHRCGTLFGTSSGPVSRQDSCAKCHGYLRSCRNCEFYEPRHKNDCAEPEAEPVGDKEAANFCEYFAPNKRTGAAAAKASTDAFDALFKK